ncbi:MAG: NAD-dependent epimerase/dehydratase family protein [Candidatus Acidiferrales bacterium]
MTANPQKVLLTGGAGFIGSHVAEALLSRGISLAIVDNLDDFYPPARKKENLEEVRHKGPFDFFAADICDTSSLREVFAAVRPNAVIHLAARAGVRPSIEQPALYERVNVSGTLKLLEFARKFGVEKFVYGSSSSVYGASSPVPFSENQRDLRPISPYAATKLAGELLAFTYAHLYGFQAVCLRFFTVYGPRQRPDLAIHKFTALMESGESVPVFGDGSAARDYTYVDDIVAGVIAALEYSPPLSDGAKFEVFNLGNSHPVTLNDLILKLEQATGRKAVRRALPAQLGDVPATWADISRAERLLAYKPQTPLDVGLEKFVRWFRSRPALS